MQSNETTQTPRDDEREALKQLLNTDHGHALMPGGNECRTCLRRVDAIMTSPVWRNRHRGPITDAMVRAAQVTYRDFPGDHIDRSSREWELARVRAALEAAEAAR